MKKMFIAAAPFFLLILVSGILAGAEAKILDTLKVEGLLVANPDAVSDAVMLRPGSAFTPADLQESVRRVYKLGHFRQVDFFVDEESDSSVSLKLVVEEFPLVDKIEFFGNKKIKKKDLEEKKLLRIYAPLSDAHLYKSKQTILDMYAEKGYL